MSDKSNPGAINTTLGKKTVVSSSMASVFTLGSNTVKEVEEKCRGAPALPISIAPTAYMSFSSKKLYIDSSGVPVLILK